MLHSGHATKAFSCGVHALDHYLRRYALVNQVEQSGITYVMEGVVADDRAGGTPVAGYYTLAMSHVAAADVPPAAAGARDPKYDKPTVLLARLAVGQAGQGRGTGRRLLIDAMRRASAASRDVGAVALEVLAVNDPAKRFYQHYGFIEYLDDSRHLFLPMKVIRAFF